MPIYEYECRACGRRFEVLQRVGDAAKPPCPECRSKRTARLISPAGFILKGSGWYKTDYPSESRKKAQEAEKGHHKKEDKGGEAKKDKKGEAAAKPKASGQD